MFLFLVNKISSSLPLPLPLQRLCPHPQTQPLEPSILLQSARLWYVNFTAETNAFNVDPFLKQQATDSGGMAGCQGSRELSPTCLLKHLAQNLETNKLESTAIKLRGDRKGSVLAWERLQFGGEVVSNTKRATLPVFPGEKELNCPPSHKYWTVLGRKFGETLG